MNQELTYWVALAHTPKIWISKKNEMIVFAFKQGKTIIDLFESDNFLNFDLTQEEIAVRVSKNRATITNSMRLLKLDDRVQQMLVESKISSGHARALLGLEDGESQYQAAKKIIQENLSVRDVEKLVKMMGRPKKEKNERETGPDINLIYRQLEDKLKTIMGTKVIINRKDKNKGRIEIEYYSQEELERLIELMESMHN